MRGSVRKQSRNQTVKSRLKTAERRFLDTVKAGKKEDAAAALRDASSSYDKAAKTGVIHRATADRKSRASRPKAGSSAATSRPLRKNARARSP